jgi:hypothetical protein
LRLPCIVLLAACVLPPVVRAQDSTHTREWAFTASVYGYLVPDSPDFLQPTVTADRRWLHLEGRYNYESPNTGSVWAGWNLHVGSKVTLDFTPMFGVVFGGINGVAPGAEITLSWWKLELSSQSEYVIDFDDESENFFYTWSQLGVSPVEWLQLGLVVQRTQLFDTGREIERGFFASGTYKWFNTGVYVFNPADTPTVVLAIGASF